MGLRLFTLSTLLCSIIMFTNTLKTKKTKDFIYTYDYRSDSNEGTHSSSFYASSDSTECHVSGCFDSFCGPMIFHTTDCIYKPEYECLKHSKCVYSPDKGCVWKHSDAYAKCIERLTK